MQMKENWNWMVGEIKIYLCSWIRNWVVYAIVGRGIEMGVFRHGRDELCVYGVELKWEYKIGALNLW